MKKKKKSFPNTYLRQSTRDREKEKKRTELLVFFFFKKTHLAFFSTFVHWKQSKRQQSKSFSAIFFWRIFFFLKKINSIEMYSQPQSRIYNQYKTARNKGGGIDDLFDTTIRLRGWPLIVLLCGALFAM